MARRLRWKRIIAAAVIAVLFIAGICFGVFKACSKDDGETSGGSVSDNGASGDDSGAKGDSGTGGDANEGGSSTDNGNGGAGNNGAGDSSYGGSNAVQVSWPGELNGVVKEYSGAGDIISADKSSDSEGKTVYKMKYKGTSIDSCFAYTKSTLEMNGEWTEAVTGELYTFSRETDKFVISLNCEPKAQNGYDLLISVKIK